MAIIRVKSGSLNIEIRKKNPVVLKMLNLIEIYDAIDVLQKEINGLKSELKSINTVKVPQKKAVPEIPSRPIVNRPVAPIKPRKLFYYDFSGLFLKISTFLSVIFGGVLLFAGLGDKTSFILGVIILSSGAVIWILKLIFSIIGKIDYTRQSKYHKLFSEWEKVNVDNSRLLDEYEELIKKREKILEYNLSIDRKMVDLDNRLINNEKKKSEKAELILEKQENINILATRLNKSFENIEKEYSISFNRKALNSKKNVQSFVNSIIYYEGTPKDDLIEKILKYS